MIARFVKIIALSILVMSGLTEARALAVGLPQVPGATQKAQAGGMSAGASLEGPSGSALEDCVPGRGVRAWLPYSIE